MKGKICQDWVGLDLPSQPEPDKSIPDRRGAAFVKQTTRLGIELKRGADNADLLSRYTGGESACSKMPALAAEFRKRTERDFLNGWKWMPLMDDVHKLHLSPSSMQLTRLLLQIGIKKMCPLTDGWRVRLKLGFFQLPFLQEIFYINGAIVSYRLTSASKNRPDYICLPLQHLSGIETHPGDQANPPQNWPAVTLAPLLPVVSSVIHYNHYRPICTLSTRLAIYYYYR